MIARFRVAGLSFAGGMHVKGIVPTRRLRRSSIGNRINSAKAEWMAAKHPSSTKKYTSPKAVSDDAFSGVVTARRVELA